jgi:hypothetical protein
MDESSYYEISDRGLEYLRIFGAMRDELQPIPAEEEYVMPTS